MQNKILLLHECKITLPKSAVRIKVFRSTKNVPTLISTSVHVSGAANERLANKAWSKCSTEYSKKHEYKGQPSTLPVNLYLTEQSTSQPIDFCAIGQSNMGSATGKENPIDRVHSRESIVYLASDASSSRLKLYVFQENVTSATKKARTVCFDNDPLNPLTFTEDTEKEINTKNICGVVTEAFLSNWTIEMTQKKKKFVVYQSTMIDYVDSVTIDEARECLGEDDMQSTNTSRRSTRSRKRNHLSEFMYYDD